MEHLFKRQAELSGFIESHFDNFKKKGSAKMTYDLALSRMKRLEGLLKEYEANDKKIKEDPNADHSGAYFESDSLYEVQESFDDVKDLYEQFLKVHAPPLATPPATPTRDSSKSSFENFNVASMIKSLPQLTLPEFDGKSADWPHFRDLFTSLIHSQKYPPIMKLSYLHLYLKGEALAIIKPIAMSAENYETAWETLKLFYENERRLVFNHLSEFFAIKPMASDTFSEVKRLVNETFAPLDALTALGRPTKYWSDIIVHVTVSKMGKNTRLEWEKSVGKSTQPSNYERVKSFLQSHALIYESIELSSTSLATKSSTQVKKPNSSTSLQSSADSQSKGSTNLRGKSVIKCNLCENSDHSLGKCSKFLQKPLVERSECVRKFKLCFNCLGSHRSKECKSTFRCLKCKGKHHSTLHDHSREVSFQKSGTQPAISKTEMDRPDPVTSSIAKVGTSTVLETTMTGATYSRSRTGVVLGTARVIVQGPDGRKVVARALIDNCSQPSFISESLAEKLSLLKEDTSSSVLAVGGVQAVQAQKRTKFIIRPHFNSKFYHEVNALVVPKVCCYSPPKTQFVSSLIYLSHLNLADPTFLDDTEVEVLLGADVHAAIIQESIIRGKPSEPIATSSLLGWLISGSIPLSTSTSHCSTVSLHCAEESSLTEILQNFWRQEELPPQKFLTPEEEECERHYVENVARDPSGRYIVKLPFKNSVDTPLGDSYERAVAMLKRQEQRFEKDPQLKQLYFDFMREYISSGHMVHIPGDSPLAKPRGECFFLPHHGVLKPSSKTTKLRTVFNGSSKTNLNVSLNNLLHTGPNLLPELTDLVSAWRTYRYVFTADIKQMFRQIKIHDNDFQFQAIVWRFSPEDPIEVYYLTTVTYGVVSSPYQATRTLRQLALDYETIYPEAAEIIKSECYVDDMLSGSHSLEQALCKQSQLIHLLKEGGFELRKWLSNEPEILSQLPNEHLASEPAEIFDSPFSFTILGLNWHAQSDSFTFKVNDAPISGGISKRKVLSKIAQIFDPLGWLAPVTISAKIFMQSLWLLKCDWDAQLPTEYVDEWLSWSFKLLAVNNITIPRFVHYSPGFICCEVHGFADASSKACSAVIYLRVIHLFETNCTLQVAKTKVAPLKTISIPRLELVAAVMLSKLAKNYVSNIPVYINSIHLWSDSKDVLFWLRSHPSKWPTFIANRCSTIQTETPTAFWHYVRSSENPADVASRGIDPQLLASHPLWWNGPSWLHMSSEPWTSTPDDLMGHTPQEEKIIKVGSVSNAITQVESPELKIWDLCSRYSTLHKLLRISAYVLRFVYKLHRRVRRKEFVNISFEFFNFLDFSDVDSLQFLTTRELNNSKLLWIYHTQRAYFKNEVEALSHPERDPTLKMSGTIRKLDPFVMDGFLRVGGRLDQSLLSYDRKHPFILPGDCFLSQLLIKDVHEQTLHGGVQLVLATLRQQVWLLNGRRAVKASIRGCGPCVLYSKQKYHQKMGDLPSYRLSPAPPFSRSGVDYAGPYAIRLTKARGRGTMKGYICLFVCLLTRGIHLELVEDYSTESFIAAFHRFTSIWGHCAELFSDNAKNFRGADLELQKMFRKNSTYLGEIRPLLAKKGTTWRWNPPGASHFGGIWEAGVKSTKHHIRRVVGDSVLTYSEMSTLLSRIQACLNSRPLLPLSDDPGDNEFLTPAHFLIHRPSYLVPEPDYTTENVPTSRRWQLISQKTQHFWKRWQSEYLSSLQPRGKWNRRTRSFQVGDIVFIRSEDRPPGLWPLARVIQTFPDKYGDNRVCKLQLSSTQLKRPSAKLILLVPHEGVQEPKSDPQYLEAPVSNLVLIQKSS